MIDFKYAQNLKPGDTIAVVQYGGKLCSGIFKGISPLGTVQFWHLSDNPTAKGNIYQDRIQGSNLDKRVAKVALKDLSNAQQADYHAIFPQVQHLIK